MCAMLKQTSLLIQNLANYNNSTEFYWGKAHKDNNDFTIMSMLTTCKDYLVDIQYRNSGHITKSDWTKEQLQSNCYYIIFPTQEHKNRFLSNIVNWLNPYEEKYGITKTVATPVENYTKTIVIEGGTEWTINTCARSFYLSFIRLCAYITEEQLSDAINGNLRYYCNETSYFSSMMKEGRKIYQYIWNNPKELFITPTDKQNNTLYEITDLSHGCTGPFYFIDAIKYNENISTFVEQHPIYQLFSKIIAE